MGAHHPGDLREKLRKGKLSRVIFLDIPVFS
jgi:hypothetical protein